MILLSVQAQVRRQAGAGSPPMFLGGVLHGFVEHVLHQYAPDTFGSVVQASPKRYAVFAPPPGPIGEHLGFGIGLYGEAEMHWHAVSAAVQLGRELRACTWHANLAGIAVTARPAPCLGNALSVHPEPVAQAVEIDFITPLKLITSTKREQGRRHEPPTFASLAGSVARRMRALEPAWAEQLGLDTPQWSAYEAQARQVALADHDVRTLASWYGSAGKQHPVPLSGLVGRLRWHGSVAQPLVDLLAAGQWIGAGQSTALGMGMYRLLPCDSIQLQP